MQIASSAKRTWSACRSASEKTATVLMPSSLQHRMILRAISPRLAMSIFLNISFTNLTPLPLPDSEEFFPVFHRLAVLDKHAHNLSCHVRFDFVHKLHRFDNTEDRSFFDESSNGHERFGRRRYGFVERTHNR